MTKGEEQMPEEKNEYEAPRAITENSVRNSTNNVVHLCIGSSIRNVYDLW